MTDMNDIRRQLGVLRERAELTQAELARRIGVSRQHISNVENTANVADKPPSMDLFAAWVDACEAEIMLVRRDEAMVAAPGEIAPMMILLRSLTNEELRALFDFARLLQHPDLPGAARRSLVDGIQSWAVELGLKPESRLQG